MSNTNTTTANTTTNLPAGLTKGSGKKIVTALYENNWKITHITADAYSVKLVATHTPCGTTATEVRYVATTATISVDVTTGKWFGANIRNANDGFLPAESVTDVLTLIATPTDCEARAIRAARQQSEQEAFVAAAEAARAAYLASDAYESFRYDRNNLRRFADMTIDTTIDTDYDAQRIIRQAERIAENFLIKRIATNALEFEGKPSNREGTEVLDLTAALDKAIAHAQRGGDARDRSTAHIMADAIARLR